MKNTYLQFQNEPIPQSKPLDDRQIKNNAGGFVYGLDKWARLNQFLILGSEGRTYYVNERSLTIDNAENVIECIKEDGHRVVNEIMQISDSGRAPKNTPALFALALCSSFGNQATKTLAYSAINVVARTGYHLLMWAAYTDNLGGTGMGWRKAVARWFHGKTPDQLAYQAIKYQQREGWALADLLRLAHVKPASQAYGLIFKYIVDGWEWNYTPEGMPDIIYDAERAKTASRDLIVNLAKTGLPREAIPTEHLKDPAVWNALLEKMPMHAMVRNLGKMSSIGMFEPFGKAAALVTMRLEDTAYIHKSRMHPLSILVALKTYQSGRGMRGKLQWDVNRSIVDALDGAFYKAFQNVEPTNQNILLALDVSGSMGSPLNNLPINCREASAALALVTLNVEPHTHVIGFTGSGNYGWYNRSRGRSDIGGVKPLDISPRQRIDDVVLYMDRLDFGTTDCALPAMYAMKNNLPVDKIVTYTDNETWDGGKHPATALEELRRHSGIDTKQVVVGMVSNGFSIADDEDPLSIDIVGFDTATPQLISAF
jgi:60 kDa SS-A/Ro ribonucleoprotein